MAEPLKDDIATDYLLNRQVAHEFNSPAVRAVFDNMASPSEMITGELQRLKAEEEQEAAAIQKAGMKPEEMRTEEQWQAEQSTKLVDPETTKAKRAALKTGLAGKLLGHDPSTMRFESEEALTERVPVGEIDPDPLVDPFMVGSAATGTPLPAFARGVTKLAPTVGKMLLRGTVGAAFEYPVGIMTELVGADIPVPKWVVNVGIGIASGLTVERFIENAIQRGMVKTTRSIGQLAKNLREGNFEDPVVRRLNEIATRLVHEETGLFIGEQAKTINPIKFKRAKELIEAGVDPERVRLATGFYQGGDKRWRWEISDKEYNIDFDAWKAKGEFISRGTYFPYRKLSEVVHHPRLFDAYPEFKDWTIQATVMQPGTAARLDPLNKTIHVNQAILSKGDYSKVKESVLHEIGHQIQEKEGWSGGGSWRDVARMMPEEFDAELLRLEPEGLDGYLALGKADHVEMVKREAAYNVYRDLAGETEARDVVIRWLNNDAEKLENFPKALKAFMEHEKIISKQMMMSDDLSTLELGELTGRMKELGFDIEDPKVFDAFMNRDFAELLPQPELLKRQSELIWKTGHNLRGIAPRMPDVDHAMKQAATMQDIHAANTGSHFGPSGWPSEAMKKQEAIKLADWWNAETGDNFIIRKSEAFPDLWQVHRESAVRVEDAKPFHYTTGIAPLDAQGLATRQTQVMTTYARDQESAMQKVMRTHGIEEPTSVRVWEADPQNLGTKRSIKAIKERFGLIEDAPEPAMARLELRNNRKKILKGVGGDVRKVGKHLRSKGYDSKIARNIQAYLESERDLPFPTTTRKDANAALKYKGLAKGTEWYRETGFGPMLEDLPDEEVMKFFAILSHTSRQSEPLGNLTKALRVWNKYRAGFSPEEAASTTGLGEPALIKMLKNPEEAFRVVRDEIGQETGEVKVADFSETMRRAVKDPESLADWDQAVVDFRMAQLYFPDRVNRKGEAMPLSSIQRERIKERINEVRNYLRKTDDPGFWTTDRVQAALWHHIKDERFVKGLDKPSGGVFFLEQRTFKDSLLIKAGQHFEVDKGAVTDEMLHGYIKSQIADPTEVKIYDHYAKRSTGHEILDPKMMGTGIRPGREQKGYGAEARLPKIHLYEGGTDVVETPFKQGGRRLRVLMQSDKIYDLDQDALKLRQTHNIGPKVDHQAIGDMERDMVKAGYMGFKSGNVAVTFDPVRAHEMKGYRLSVSPSLDPNSWEKAINKAVAEADYGAAGAMRTMRELADMGDYTGMERFAQEEVERIFDHPLIDIAWARGAQGRWAGGKEFALDFTVEAGDYDILRGRVAQFLKRFNQSEGYISKHMGFGATPPSGMPEGQGPSFHLKFPRALNEKELERFSELLGKNGIGGSTYVPKDGELIIHHITKYGKNPQAFAKKLLATLEDWTDPQISMFRSADEAPVPKYSQVWFKHEILDGGTDHYDRAINRATNREKEIGLGITPHEPRGGERTPGFIQERYTPSEYQAFERGRGEPTPRGGILQRLRGDQRGTVWGDPLAKSTFRFQPEQIDIPFKDKTFADRAANLNLNNIEDEKGIHNALEQIAQVFEPEIQQARRYQVKNKVTQERALKEETLKLSELLGRAPGGAFNAEEALRARILLTSSAQNLVDLAAKASSLHASDMDKLAFQKAFGLHGAIQTQVSGMTAEAGRALQAFKITAGPQEVVSRQIRDIMEKTPGGVPIEKLAAMVATFDDPAKIGKFVNKAVHASGVDMLIELWINGLLSGPQTHVVNITSTILTTGAQVPERALAAQISKALGRKPGEGVAVGEATEMMHGFLTGMSDGFRFAGRVLKTGELVDPHTKIELEHRASITAENVRNLWAIKKMAPNALEEGGIGARAVDLMGSMVRIPGYGLSLEDAVQKTVGYRMELGALALRKATGEFPGDHAKISKRVAEILADPDTHAPEITLAAQDFSRYATFTNELGKYGKGFQKFAQHPMMKLVTPFVRTPTNIFKFGMERTPFGIVKVIRAGTPAERDLALARVALGSTAMAVTGMFAHMGGITGGGPSDPKLNAALRRTGWQPYSIKVGNKYVSYNRIEPLGMLLGFGADFAELSGFAGEELQADMENLAAAMAASFAKNASSKTWLKGFSDAINVMSDPDRYGKRYVERLTGTVVPSLVAGVERAVDPEQQAVWGMMDAIKARVPGWSTDLPPRRDLWGDPISNQITDNKWLQGAYGFVSPVYISEGKDSPIDKELVRLKIGLNYPLKTQSIMGIPVPMEPWEYDELMVHMNSEPVRSGKNLKDSLNALVGEQQYKDAPAEIKEAMIRDIVNAAVGQAKIKLYNENLTVRQYVDSERLSMATRGRP